MAAITCFEDLKVWKDARIFAKEIYFLTEKDKFSKEFRFKEQIKSSSGSVTDNIAEGFERDGNKEFIQFLFIAKGSVGETRSQLHRAFDVNLIDETEYKNCIEKALNISQSLSNFIAYLKNSEM
ncbi:MAG: four helix bundle protein, partial [Paludibacter sp.]|nr:four helix bundle protein [Paludibacter sp.]